MIRIETTATFDAEGRISISDRIDVPVVPGTHRIVLEVCDVDPAVGRDTSTPVLVREHGLLLINAAPIPGADLSVARILDALRDDPREGMIDGDAP